MSVSSRFIKVHPDALIQWTWDDDFFYADNYSIVKDTINNVSSFEFSKTAQDAANYNKIPQQLYLIDPVINKFGIADPDTKTFLQESAYANNAPSKFDKVKIYFPIHYTFPNYTGFYLRIYALNYDNAIPYSLSNYYLDVSIPSELLKIEEEAQPIRYNERLWGKSITIYVPSVYAEALNRTNNAPSLGTINYNLTNGISGLSQTTPIFIDFRFLINKTTVLGDTTFIATPPLIVSLPQAPEFNNLAVTIQEATDGDYFTINGLFNGSAGEFDTFMTGLSQAGRPSYIIYSVTVFEENIQQEPRDIFVFKDFFKGVDNFKPVLKYSNTTASIQVEMKLVSSVDGSIVSRIADITLSGNTVAKYGKIATPINVSNALKPKIYNSKPDQLVLPAKDVLNSHIKRKIKNVITNISYVPYPVLTNNYNIVAQDVSHKIGNDTYFGFGDLEMALTPFDNIIKIRIAKQTTTNVFQSFVFPVSNSIVQLVFKSATSELRVPLYTESNEVNLQHGVLVFRITANQHPILKKIFETNKNFYITLTTNGVETSVYDSKFTLLDEVPRVTNGNNVLNGVSSGGNISVPTNPKFNESSATAGNSNSALKRTE